MTSTHASREPNSLHSRRPCRPIRHSVLRPIRRPALRTTHYTVARLDLPRRTLTARLNYTLTHTITLQWYGEAYVSHGPFTNVRELDDPRAPTWERRFRPYEDPNVADNPGGVDFRCLRSNAVFRWEYRPGSTPLAVWAQGRDVDGSTAGSLPLWPGRDLHGLFATRPTYTLAVKASYLLTW